MSPLETSDRPNQDIDLSRLTLLATPAKTAEAMTLQIPHRQPVQHPCFQFSWNIRTTVHEYSKFQDAYLYKIVIIFQQAVEYAKPAKEDRREHGH
jgi:hypothetical protein